MNEILALALTPVLLVALVVASESYKGYRMNECLKAYATSTKTADEITKICK
jgi:hypothetical protein